MIGKTVSHYRILSNLGRGGMGVVYAAEDLHLGRRVAVKFSTAAPENALYRARFLREARAASALNHPHIAGIYDYGETPEGQPFIVMELVSGEDLFHLMRRRAMSLLQAMRIVEEVAEALGEAHRYGILHRDIKPANIFINERGQVKVLDFGLAKHFEDLAAPRPAPGENAESSETIQGTVLGTPQYMSPEQAKDAPLDPRSDLFALGSVLYECLAGRPAFPGATSVEILGAVLHVEPPPPSEFNPRVTPEMDRIALKALAKGPEERYQTADEMAADLRAARLAVTQSQTQETEILTVVPATPAAAWDTARTTLAMLTAPLARRRRSILGSLALLALALAAGWWLFLRPYQPPADALRWYREGVTALRDGTYYKASKALEQAAARDSRFTLAHARLAEAWLELDYADRAKEEMLRAAPPGSAPRLKRTDQLYMQALGLTLTGDYAAAVEKYRDIVKRTADAEKADVYVDLGRALEKNEEPKEAMAAYQEATRLEVQDPAPWLRQAILYGRQLDQPRAAAAFHEAEQLYHSLSNLEGVTEVLYQRGVLANRVGRRGDAAALLHQALDMSRNTGNLSQQILVSLQLGVLEYGVNNLAQAQTDASDALDLARANGLESLTTRGLLELGNAHFAQGKNAEAKKYYEQALEYASRYRAAKSEARARLSLGSLAMQVGDTAEALRNIEPALAWYQRGGYQKETAQALTLISRAQRKKGDYPAALHSFEQQLQIARKVGDQTQAALAEQGIGTVLEQLGRWPEALEHFRKGYETARQANDRQNATYNLGRAGGILWQLGRYDEARESLAEAARDAAPDAMAATDTMSAEMALSRSQYSVAIGLARRALTGPSAFSAVKARCVLGLALMGSGARRDGLSAAAEAVAVAAKTGDPWNIAVGWLAYGEALLAAGGAAKALENAQAAQQWFARIGNPEPEWRCWLVASRAALALADAAHAREYAGKASDVLASLSQKWEADSYRTYSARPDIAYLRGQLARLLAAK